METLETLRSELGASVILIGHDMGLMAQTVTRLGVMYAGDIVEMGDIEDLFSEPLHPYTRLLMASLPSLEQKQVARGIPGLAPSLLNRPKGCPFHPRCPEAFDRCLVEEPKLQAVRPNHAVACHLHWAQSAGMEAQ
jgi:peptide/nickel transport system ATP-binding protein